MALKASGSANTRPQKASKVLLLVMLSLKAKEDEYNFS